MSVYTKEGLYTVVTEYPWYGKALRYIVPLAVDGLVLVLRNSRRSEKSSSGITCELSASPDSEKGNAHYSGGQSSSQTEAVKGSHVTHGQNMCNLPSTKSETCLPWSIFHVPQYRVFDFLSATCCKTGNERIPQIASGTTNTSCANERLRQIIPCRIAMWSTGRLSAAEADWCFTKVLEQWHLTPVADGKWVMIGKV